MREQFSRAQTPCGASAARRTVFEAYAPVYAGLARNELDVAVAHYNVSRLDALNLSSCAVVGTSSSLMARARGAAIDAHSLVIRVNGYPLDPLRKEWLGSRTDVAVLSFSRFARPRNRTMVVFACRWSGSCWSGARSDHVPRLSPRLVSDTRRRYGLTRWPSTGLLAVSMAQRLCTRVSTFGFGINTSHSNCTHYYNMGSGGRCVLPRRVHFRNSRSRYDAYASTHEHQHLAEAALVRNVMPTICS